MRSLAIFFNNKFYEKRISKNVILIQLYIQLIIIFIYIYNLH